MRRILVPLNGPEDAASLLHLAGHLASPFGAQIEAALIHDRAGLDDDAERAEAAAPERHAGTRQAFDRWAAASGGASLEGNGAMRAAWREIPDGVVYASASLGRACDLIVTRALGRTVEDERVIHPGRDARGFRDAFLASGRLTLLAPSSRVDAAALLDHVVVAWDGSAGAAHALGQSLALLGRAKSVRIVIIGRNTVGERARDAIESYVGLYNENTRLLVHEHGHRQTGRALLDVMRMEHASMAVIGVCGRSHPAGAAGALGGTILKVIEDNRIPILTAN